MKRNLKNDAATAIKLAVASILLGSWTTVQAATVSFNSNWTTTDSVSGGEHVPIITDILDNQVFRNVSQFNSALGVLQSIDVSFFGMALQSNANANFRDDDIANIVAGRQTLQNMSLNVSMPGFGFSRFGIDRTDTCSDGPNLGSAVCNTLLSTGTLSLAGAGGVLTDAGLLAAYTGLGTVSISINQFASLVTEETDGDNGYVDLRFGNFNTFGSLSVTYNYAPVPLPAVAWLFGSGLLGLVGVARRKKVA